MYVRSSTVEGKGEFAQKLGRVTVLRSMHGRGEIHDGDQNLHGDGCLNNSIYPIANTGAPVGRRKTLTENALPSLFVFN